MDAWPPIPKLEQVRVELPIGRLSEYASARLRRSKLPWYGKSPDRYRPWVEPALEAALAAYEKADPKPEALVTFGTPWSDHLLGLRLKKRLGLPWVAHFSDLWADWKYISLDAVSRAGVRRLERRVIENADRVIFITEGMRRVCMAKYPPAWADKARVLPHLFDPADYPPAPARPPASRCIRFMGDIFAGERQRPVKPFLAALGELRGQSPELLEGVCFEFYGPWQKETGRRSFAHQPSPRPGGGQGAGCPMPRTWAS